MNRFAPQTTNNFYPDLETGVGGYPAVNHRHRELDFAQPGHDVAEESIRFATRRSFLGLVLVAASEKGICAILLGDDANCLGAELRSRFRKATLIAGDAGFQEMAAKVVHAVETPGSKLDLPLDLRGTEFQRRVWQALREIPVGAHRHSLAQVSRRRGSAARMRTLELEHLNPHLFEASDHAIF